MNARALGLLLGYGADRLLGDPQRGHPVAGFGTWALACERQLYTPSRTRGTCFVVVTTAPWVGLAVLATHGPASRTLVTAAVTWAALGGRSLEREALAVHELLFEGDLEGARRRIRSLVGRDTSALEADALARAVVESLAENQSDAVAATLVWGALAGAPGIVLHRCVNTLDAMVGHRSERYADFGWAAARLDDVLNWLPARVSLLATAAVAGATDGTSAARRVLTGASRDGARHPSPNAGPVEAAAAYALGVQLGGLTTYGGRVEDRGQLGDGRPVSVGDIRRAATLTRQVGLVVLGAAVTATAMGGRLRRR